MKAFARARRWLFPASKITDATDRERWHVEDRQRVKKITAFGIGVTVVLLVPHWVVIDMSLGTAFKPTVMAFRLGLALLGSLIVAASRRPFFQELRYVRAPLATFGLLMCVGQAAVMRLYPNLPIVFPAFIAALYAYALFDGPAATAGFLAIGLGLQHVILFFSHSDNLILISGEAVIFLAIIALRATQDEPRQFLMRVAMEEVERLRSLRMVVEGIAHDILNPIGFIPNAANLLAELGQKIADAKTKAEQQRLLEKGVRYLDIIDKSLARTSEAIEALRRCARGKQANETVVDTDVNQIAQETARLAHGGNEIKLDLRATGTCKTQRNELQRVLLNLVINAQQAGRPDISIELASCDHQNGVVISVHDDGPGIPDEILKRIFEPYFTTKGGGTGMGLALAKNFAEAHGGWIRAENRHGALLSLFLPRDSKYSAA